MPSLASPSPFPDTPASLLSALRLPEETPRWDASWHRFINLYRPAIRFSIIRSYARVGWTSLDDSLLDETVSDVCLSIHKAQEEFKYDAEKGKFRNFVRQLADWRVKDKLKSLRRWSVQDELKEDLPSGESTAFEQIDALERDAWRKTTLYLLLEEVRSVVSPRTFLIFEETKLNQRPVEIVQTELGVTRSTIDNANHRVVRKLRELAQTPEFQEEFE